jgi:hypothetical protein
MGGGIVVGPPKSRAGLRTVTVPTSIRAEIVGHLAEFVDAGPDALVFTGVQGRALHRGVWGQRVNWMEVVTKLGLAGLHFHDLRHAGNIWASNAGMSTKDLVARMGHDDMRAALIYQRATSDADRLIADRLSLLIDEHRRRHPEPRRTTTVRNRARQARWPSCCAVATDPSGSRNDEGPAPVWTPCELGLRGWSG